MAQSWAMYAPHQIMFGIVIPLGLFYNSTFTVYRWTTNFGVKNKNGT